MEKVFACVYNSYEIKSEKVLKEPLVNIGNDIGKILDSRDDAKQKTVTLTAEKESLNIQLASLYEKHDKLVKKLTELEKDFNQKLKTVKTFLNDDIISLLVECKYYELPKFTTEQFNQLRDFHDSFLAVKKVEDALLDINQNIFTSQQKINEKTSAIQSLKNYLPNCKKNLWENIYQIRNFLEHEHTMKNNPWA